MLVLVRLLSDSVFIWFSGTIRYEGHSTKQRNIQHVLNVPNAALVQQSMLMFGTLTESEDDFCDVVVMVTVNKL